MGCAFLDAVSQQIEHCGAQAFGMLRVTGSCFSIARTDLKAELDSSLSGTLADLQGDARKGDKFDVLDISSPILALQSLFHPRMPDRAGTGSWQVLSSCFAVQGSKGSDIKAW